MLNIGQLADPLLYTYRYDQLNRLTKLNANRGLNNATNTWAPVAIQDYSERISYDPNGNIGTYLRNGSTAGGKPLAMDNLTYTYKPGTNQLSHVADAVPAANYSIDIDGQNTLNYSYDQIGNLTADVAEGITNIAYSSASLF
jgi:hypothetical protein